MLSEGTEKVDRRYSAWMSDVGGRVQSRDRRERSVEKVEQETKEGGWRGAGRWTGE